jgi:hypothetical protein
MKSTNDVGEYGDSRPGEINNEKKENSTRKDQLQAAFLKPYGPLQYADRYRDAAFTILSYSKHAQDCSWSTPIGAQFFVTFSHHIIYFQLLKHCHTNFS